MKKIIVLFAFFIISLPLIAQVHIEKSGTVIKSEGKSFYLHTVKQGHTLYSISKTYGVDQKKILRANDMDEAALKVGQKLKIPVLNPVSEQASEEALFFYHKVKSGETLYSIARQYDTATETILAFNPKSRYGLHVGQILTIPNQAQGHADQQDESFHFHTVISGETLFSLSQQYGVSIKQIQLFNPETKTELKAGSTLKIPKTAYEGTETLPVSKYDDPNINSGTNDPNYFTAPDDVPCYEYRYRPTHRFKVAMMLPLFIEKNLWAIRNYDEIKNKAKFFGSTGRFLEFYQGAMLAVNQMKYDGVSVEFHVFDTKNDQTEVRSLLSKMNLSEYDLIIGPVYSDNFKIVAQEAKKHRVNIVSPLSANTDNLINNPYAFQPVPSNETRIKKTADLISKFYDTTVVIIHNGTKEELQNIEIYKKKLVKSFASRKDINEIALKVVNYNYGGKSNIEDAFSIGNKNLVLIPDDKEAFVTGVAEQLYLFAKDYDITLIGSPNWELFQNINIAFFKRMDFNYASSYYIDYNHWRTKQFIKKFRTAYKTEPGLYAFQGYDISYFFMSALKEYGRHFQFCLQNNPQQLQQKGIVFDFDFYRTGTYNGFENKGMHFLKYDENYQLVQSNVR